MTSRIAMRSQYSGDESACCVATLRRPVDAHPASPWFCTECGTPVGPEHQQGGPEGMPGVRRDPGAERPRCM